MPKTGKEACSVSWLRSALSDSLNYYLDWEAFTSNRRRNTHARSINCPRLSGRLSDEDWVAVKEGCPLPWRLGYPA